MAASIDARDRTLGMQSLWDLLRKLYWELHLVDAMPERLRVGVEPSSVLGYRDARLYGLINAALTSLAMLDWLEILVRDPVYRQRLDGRYPALAGVAAKELKSRMRKLEPMLQVCHQIGNAFKHRDLVTYDVGIKVHPVEVVTEEADGSVWVSSGGLVMAGLPSGGGRVDKMLCDLCDWWHALLRDLQVAEV